MRDWVRKALIADEEILDVHSGWEVPTEKGRAFAVDPVRRRLWVPAWRQGRRRGFLVMNQKGAQKLLQDKIKLGADASVAATLAKYPLHGGKQVEESSF